VCVCLAAIGSLRYAHVECPSRQELHETALTTVGQSRAALKHFQKAAKKVKIGVTAMGSFRKAMRHVSPKRSPTNGHAAAGSQLALASSTGAPGSSVGVTAMGSFRHHPGHNEHDDDDDDAHFHDLNYGEDAQLATVGGLWAEVVGAWLASDASAKERFRAYRRKYLEDRGDGGDARQPIGSRVAGLEVELRQMQKRRGQGGGGLFGCCCGGGQRSRRPKLEPGLSKAEAAGSGAAAYELQEEPRRAKVMEP
jgi:hypothetical protein